jgi:hypothetical protein
MIHAVIEGNYSGIEAVGGKFVAIECALLP